jgi:hypothetical protein
MCDLANNMALSFIINHDSYVAGLMTPRRDPRALTLALELIILCRWRIMISRVSHILITLSVPPSYVAPVMQLQLIPITVSICIHLPIAVLISLFVPSTLKDCHSKWQLTRTVYSEA